MFQVRLQTSNAYKGTLDCVVKTFQKEGAGGFLKGMAFPLASVAAYNAVVFGVYRCLPSLRRVSCLHRSNT